MATTNKDKDVIGIAKGTSGTKKTTSKKPTARKTTRKPAAKKTTTAKKLTPEQERDLKAKQKVEDLLKDAELTPKKEDDLLELDEEPKQEPKGVDWLEEQVQVLIDENKALKAENQQLKEGGNTTTGNATQESVVKLFDELQNMYIKMGTNSQTGRGNFEIYTPGFLNRMIKFFPFLKDFKKY